MNVLHYEKKEKPDSFDKICFWTILIDIFFLPYFSIISTSYSIPVIVFWFLMRGRRTHSTPEYKYFPFVVLWMIIAVGMCSGYSGKTLYETTSMTSLKRFVQYVTSFCYFFFFVYYIKRYKQNLNNIVFWAVVYVAALALIYFLFRDKYATVKAAIHPADNHTRRWLSGVLYDYRYNFLWSDPNNVAYAVTSMVLFYFSEDKEGRVLRKTTLLVALVFVLFCTMSIGGMIMGAISLAFFLMTGNKRKITINAKSVIGIPIILIVCVLAVGIFRDKLMSFFTSDVIDGLSRRITFYDGASDMSGGRFGDLTNAVELLNPLFVFIGSGKEGITTENGHIYLIAMYGLPVYLYFMYVLFGKKKMKMKKYIIFLPLFAGFTMNIAIIEQKYLLIIMLISAYFSAYGKNTIDYIRSGTNK